ncbi:MAG: hypothetical protein QM639_10630 [Rhodocyclaceae bacterium]
MFRRFRSPRLAWFIALLLAFSQLVTAAYACVQEQAPAHEHRQSAPHAGHAGMGSDAHHAMAGMPDCDMTQQAQPITCKVHCEKNAQSADVRLPNLSAPVLFALFLAPPMLTADQAAPPAARPEPPTLVAASPPLRLQYQVFRN